MMLTEILRGYSQVLRSSPSVQNEFLAIKQTPPHILSMQRRLNSKLQELTNTTINRIFDNAGYDIMEFQPLIRTAWSDYVPRVYNYGAMEVVKSPGVELNTSILNDKKLDKIFDTRSFNASQTTVDRLEGDVFSKIRQGISEGFPLDRTRDQLESEFRDMAKWELKRISRTETNSIYNQSKLETMLKSNVISGKKWVSSGLDNMRPAHAEADGQVVDVQDPFVVGNEELMFPGDPSGSAENIINCSCTFLPVLNLSSNLS